MIIRLKTVALFSLSLLPAAPVFATSIVCIRTPDAIAIAADSKLAIRGAEDPGKELRECKIIRAGGTFFSLTGFVKDPARPYDAARLVAGALKGESDFTESTASVADAVKTGLKDEVLKLRAEAAELYEKFIKGEKGTLVKVLLADYEEGTPHAAVLGFRLAVSPSGDVAISVEREECPGDCDPKGIYMFVLGDRRPVDAYLQNGKVEWHAPEQGAKSLVEAVIAAHTPDVGPPVDILRIDRDGARWIEKKEECPEITE